MRIEIVDETITPLTDEEILNFSRYSSPVDFGLDRRTVLKTIAVVPLIIGGITTPTKDADAFWGLVARFTIFAVGVATVGFFEEAGASVYRSVSSDSDYPIWKQRNHDNFGGIQLINSSSKSLSSGRLITSIYDSGTNNLEDDVLEREFTAPPYARHEFKLLFRDLPFTGLKYVNGRTASKNVETKKSSIVRVI